MGRIIELNNQGDSSIIFGIAGIAAAAGAFAGYISHGWLTFEVGERHPEGVYECEKCKAGSKLSNESGELVKTFSPQACTVVAHPARVGG